MKKMLKKFASAIKYHLTSDRMPVDVFSDPNVKRASFGPFTVTVKVTKKKQRKAK